MGKIKLIGLNNFLQLEMFDFRDLMVDYYEAYKDEHPNDNDYERLLDGLKQMNDADPVGKWYLYETLNKGRSYPFDCDNSGTTCQLAAEIYETLWSEYPESLDFCKKTGTPKDEKDKATTVGDTMNSVQTTLNQMFIMLADKFGLTLLKGRWKWTFKECLKLYDTDAAKFKCVVEAIDGAKDFLKAAYTIGNFIPVPSETDDGGQSFNKKRNSCYAQDYWDRTLYCIYKWYTDTSDERDKWLVKLLYGKGKSRGCLVDICIDWLKSFQDEKGNPSWDVFVEKNYLQDYTERATKPYGCPEEFWDGHFSGEVLPKGDQIEQFFKSATACIKARSKRMVDALRERSKNQGKE